MHVTQLGILVITKYCKLYHINILWAVAIINCSKYFLS